MQDFFDEIFIEKNDTFLTVYFYLYNFFYNKHRLLYSLYGLLHDNDLRVELVSVNKINHTKWNIIVINSI